MQVILSIFLNLHMFNPHFALSKCGLNGTFQQNDCLIFEKRQKVGNSFFDCVKSI